MMLKNFRFSSSILTSLFLVIISVTLSLICFTYLSRSSETTVVYVVDNGKLFDGFRMTKEIKRKGEHFIKDQKIRMDSLNVQFAIAESDAQKQHIYEIILKERQDAERFNQAYSEEETAKIWNRIEGYAKEYGKLKEYGLLIGSQQQGDVLYVDQKIDVTDDLLNYINKKYEGFN